MVSMVLSGEVAKETLLRLSIGERGSSEGGTAALVEMLRSSIFMVDLSVESELMTRDWTSHRCSIYVAMVGALTLCFIQR